MSSTPDNCDLHLHAEIELLKNTLVEKQTQLNAMETECMQEHNRQVELEDSVVAWQDKYDRLYESHKRVQKVNQNLEDKLLKLVDRNSGERAQLTSDVATLSVRLAQANYTIAHLQREIERYKTDMGLAIQLLQCKPDSFVPQKITSLPIEMQSKVVSYMRLDTNSHSDSEGSTSGVGVATQGSYSVLPASDSPPPACPFPPTAMVYSMRGLDNSKDEMLLDSNSQPNEHQNNWKTQLKVSPSIMAKFLENELKSNKIKHCVTCDCTIKEITTLLAETPKTFSIGTQTMIFNKANPNSTNSLCLRCNSNLNSPSRTSSPYIMKLYKSNDSIKSESQSNNQSPTNRPVLGLKNNDLTVNPLLGHHRLCDRTTNVLTTISDTITDSNDIININNEVILVESGTKYPSGRSSAVSNYSHKNNIDSNESRIEENDISNDENKLIEKKEDVNNRSNSDNGTVGNCGSTNSLWSKTSTNSAEASKLFENFNLNLIKTIKLENPKMTGPRLCALRIPSNGSNNILLDNLEPTLSPVIYTKRSRFLDEELNDFKDVITTVSSNIDSDQNRIIENSAIVVQPLSDPSSMLLLSDSKSSILSRDLNDNKTDSEKYRESQTQQQIVSNESIEILDKKDESENKINLLEAISSIKIDSEQKPNNELTECAILRRHQLNRVAEWVQNNNINHDGTDIETVDDIVTRSNGFEGDIYIANNELINISDGRTNNNNNENIHPQFNLSFNCPTNLSYINNNTSNFSSTKLSSSLCDDKKLDDSNQLSNSNAQTNNNSIAQMEYNVRQFLLKQNEWSIHNKLSTKASAFNTKTSSSVILNNTNTTNTAKQTTLINNACSNGNFKFRTETNL